nr:hunchback transcription factor [Hymenolepis microstoma]
MLKQLESSAILAALSSPFLSPTAFQVTTKSAEAGSTRLDLNSTDSERKSLELEIDAKNINESTGSTPSTSDLKKISPTSLNSTSWLSMVSDRSRTCQEQATLNDRHEITPPMNSSSGQLDFFTGSLKRSTTGVFQCHICSYQGANRAEFLAHLRVHYPYHCEFCDYASRTEGRLRHHKDAFHSETQPKNFSGKSSKRSAKSVRIYKCKDCDFSSQTKPELWTHMKEHMKSKRKLECSLCPFVTELAHHFDYHMKNHYGEKPFKCNKCNYVCVNKSMLNSHYKSHSNIYQYRCSVCKYASKYLHSLKQHLRRHKNADAVVLNADGSLPEDVNSLAVQPQEDNQQTPKIPLPPSNLPLSPFPFSPSSMSLASQSPMKLMEHWIAPSLFPPGIFSTFSLANLAISSGSIQPPNSTDLVSRELSGFSESQPQNEDSRCTQSDEAPLDLSASKVLTIKTEEIDSTKPGEYGCSLCSIQFPDSQTASKHLALHDFSDPTRCKSCGFQCNPSISLNDHLKESRKCSK